MSVILLIDPKPAEGSKLARILTLSGHDVLRVETLLAAVRVLKKTLQVDVAVFRDEFETLDGFTVPELIRLFRLPSIAISDDPAIAGADFSVSESAEQLLEALGKIRNIPTNA